MFSISKKSVIAAVLALLISLSFLWSVLTPGSIYNFWPLSIHESGDSNKISEKSFIRTFDILSAFIILILAYISIYKLFIEIEQNKKSGR